MSEVISIPRGLVRAVQEHRIVPFVGAGVSMGVKPGLFPSWHTLMEDLIEELRQEACPAEAIERALGLMRDQQYVQVAEVGLRQLGAYRFNSFLRQRFYKRRPAELDYSVPRAVWALRAPVVITTNYDAAMRWAMPVDHDGQAMDIQVVANDQAEELALLHEASSEWPWLWHIHGTIERLSTLILAGSDYRRLYGGDDQMRSHRYERALFDLQTKLATQPLLYVGFSLSDPYVLQQIADVLALTKGKNAPSYALMKAGLGDRGALWENYNIQLVEYRDHGAPLAELLSDIRRRAFGEPAPELAAVPESRLVAAFQARALSSPAPARERAAGGEHADEDADDELSLESAGDADLLELVPRGPAMGSAPAARPAPMPASSMGAPQPAPAPPPVVEPLAEPVHSDPAISLAMPRPALEREYAAELARSRRLLVLSPRGGGSRTMARQLAQAYGPRLTWLTPPNVPGCTAREYFSFLVEDAAVESFLDLETRLRHDADQHAGEHLVLVRHDGGPREHLQTLGVLLRRLMESDTRFHMLMAGEANCARLRFQTEVHSLFTGAPVRHVPALEPEVARAMIRSRAGLVGDHVAEALYRATGGHPGMLAELLYEAADLVAADDVYAVATERLSRSVSVRGVLASRLAEDDRDNVPERRHARTVLTSLLEGRSVRRLEEFEDEWSFAEVRLYYDGLVVADHAGDTRLRCEAVTRAVMRALQ